MRNSAVNFIKGILIGIGAVLPGLSGGVLAAIFGLYEPLIAFLANVKKDVTKNIRFFLPVVLGGFVGVFLLSHALGYFLNHHLAEISLFFVGCMLGVFPALNKKAAEKGRKPLHLALTLAVAVSSFLGLLHLRNAAFLQLFAPNFNNWLLSGALIGLGFTFPGLSPSNFLMYLGLYQPLNAAISQLQFDVLLPVALGGAVAILLTAKLVSYLLRIGYTIVYHVILGLVLTGIATITPRTFASDWIAAGMLILGLSVGIWMSRLEQHATSS